MEKISSVLNKYKAVNVLKAAFGCCAVGYIFETTNTTFTWALLALFAFIAFFYLFKAKDALEKNKRRSTVAALNALIFTFFTGSYYFLKTLELTLIHGRSYFCFALFCVLVGSFFVFKAVIELIFEKVFTFRRASLFEYPAADKKASRKIFLIAFLVTFIGYGFYYCINFPGFVIRDTLYQVLQNIEMRALTTHHPVIHTKLLGALYILGISVFGDERGGIALYTFVQFTCYALSAAYMISTMYVTGFKKKIWVTALIINAFYPPTAYLSTVVCKDVFEASAMIMLTSIIWRILYGPKPKEEKGKPWYKRDFFNDRFFEYLGVFVFGVLTALFRSGGKYVMLAVFVYALITVFKKNKRIIVLLFAVLPVTFFIQNYVYVKMLGATTENRGEKDYVEMLSVPLMQVARSVYLDRPLTPKEKEMIEKYTTTERMKQMYSVNFFQADGVKDLFRANKEVDAKYFGEHLADYGKVWLAIGSRYPQDYVRGWAFLTSSFWMPGARPLIFFDDGFEVHLLDELPDWTVFGKEFEKGYGTLVSKYGKIPFLNIFFDVGLMVWALLISAFACVYKRKYRELTVYVPICVTFLILLVGCPIWRDVKYIAPLMNVLPFLFFIPVYEKPEQREETAELPDNEGESEQADSLEEEVQQEQEEAEEIQPDLEGQTEQKTEKEADKEV